MQSRTRSGVLLTVWLTAVSLCLATGCTGPTMAGDDTGKDKEAEAPPPKRSYENPNVPMTDTELAEIERFCEATMTCVKKRCDLDEIARTFKAVKVSSTWGKTLQKHFAGSDLDGIGRRLGKLVDEEGLHHKSMACRRVRARFD